MKKQSYCAIIGDINRSRDLPDRAKMQRQFLRTIDSLNREFKESIVSDFRFRVSHGDAFEGLLIAPAESYRFARRLQDLMKPAPFSIGIGIGSLSTKLVKNVDTVDGEAFYRARCALELATKNRQEVVFDFDSSALLLTNALVGLIEKEWGRLTSRQREVIERMKELKSQEAVAKKLKITQPAVSKVLGSPIIRTLTEAEKALHEFLACSFP
jgi:hypothetical protein